MITETKYKEALSIIAEYEAQSVNMFENYNLDRLLLIMHNEMIGQGNKSAAKRAWNFINTLNQWLPNEGKDQIKLVSDLVKYYRETVNEYPRKNPDKVFMEFRNCGKKVNDLLMSIIRPHLLK